MHEDAMNSLSNSPSSQKLGLVDHSSSLPSDFTLLPFTAQALPISFNIGLL